MQLNDGPCRTRTFLLHSWANPPARVDEFRRHLASAYRYVCENLDNDRLLASLWEEARPRARVYGARRWHEIGPELAIDDLQSPLIRKFLADDRVIVASAHLGETKAQIAKVAKALGLRLLSAEVTVKKGPAVAAPPGLDLLAYLTEALAALEDRRPIRSIEAAEHLSLHISGSDHSIRAFVEDDILYLVGEPQTFAVEAAGQLVEHFQLTQRGNEVSWLTGALFQLGSPSEFHRSVQVLAEGLGIELPEPAESPDAPLDDETQGQQDPAPSPEDTPHADDSRDADDETASDSYDSSHDGSDDRAGHSDDQAGGSDDQAGDSDDQAGDSDDQALRERHHRSLEPRRSAPSAARQAGHGTGSRSRIGTSGSTHGGAGRAGSSRPSPEGRSHPGGRARDHFRALLVSRTGRTNETEGAPAPHSAKDDHKARKVVVRYESLRGRDAKEMDASQPGYDVLSVESTGKHRRIEIKSVQGKWEGDASVVLTGRQFRDAFEHDDDDVDYWLYVVDSTETPSPRVFPIPWPRYRNVLHCGFYASEWATDAELPANVGDQEMVELSIDAMQPMDPGDLDEDWELDDVGVGE